MATIYVDGKAYPADAKQNLLNVCLGLGFDLPYFCWHPAMGSVGACRQCAVKQFKDENDKRGRLVMACMTPAAEGTRISIADPEAVEFRKGIIEGLMQSHPHDCPVCDEGGECHLQDMTVMTGHDYRSYRFEKRTFRNQYLGPLVNQEMNRCIQCYRCVRFYREYAGGRDFNSFVMRNLVFFGRDADGVLENEFSGNLVEVCPTGVFTDKTLKRHYTRKWDLQMAPTLCVHCGLGCNVSAGERYGGLRRIVNRFNREVNGYFLCDRGRYGYEFVNSARRIRQPRLRGEPIPAAAARETLREMTAGGAIGIGSPRASLEANYTLRALVGADRFYAGVPGSHHRLVSLMLELLRGGPARPASLADVERSDAVLVLGEDVTNVAPRMALSLRQAVRQQPMQIAETLRIPLWMDHAVREAIQERRGPLFIVTPKATHLDDIAAEVFRLAPDDIARFGFELPERVAQALDGAARPLVVAGPSLNNEAIIRAAAHVARRLCREGRTAGLAFTMPECNSFGLGMIGGEPLEAAFQAVDEGKADSVIILENDLYRRLPREQVEAFFAKARRVIVLDQMENETAAKAELLLPAATFAESDGTLVSSEGRAQRFFPVMASRGEVQASWRWLAAPLADARGSVPSSGGTEPRPSGSGAWATLDDVIAALIADLPQFARIRDAAPPETFRVAGAKVPREPHRYSGRTAMLANISVHEPKPPEDPDSPLSFSMEGAPVQPPSPLIPFFWAPGWNSIQAVNKYQREVGDALRGGDPGVRLVEASAANGADLGLPPPAFQAREDEWLVLPLYHIFGSEELSRHAPGIAELSPKPYVAVNPEDAARLSAGAGETVAVLGRQLPLRIEPGLPRGVAGLPAGLAGLEGIALPAWSRISRQL